MKTVHPYMPHLTLAHVDFSSPSPSGVRAQALNPDGKLVEDFVFGIFFTHLTHLHSPYLRQVL
jgi:hypothetical protein